MSSSIRQVHWPPFPHPFVRWPSPPHYGPFSRRDVGVVFADVQPNPPKVRSVFVGFFRPLPTMFRCLRPARGGIDPFLPPCPQTGSGYGQPLQQVFAAFFFCQVLSLCCPATLGLYTRRRFLFFRGLRILIGPPLSFFVFFAMSVPPLAIPSLVCIFTLPPSLFRRRF